MNYKALLFILILTPLSLFAQELTLETYNVGLADSYVAYTKERRPHIVEALRKSDADIICLQEVWAKKDRRKIRRALKSNYPHQFSSPIKNLKSKSAPTCRYKELFGEGRFVSCIQKQCKGKPDSEYSDCVLKQCDTPLQSLKLSNRECATSLLAQVGKTTIGGLATVMNPFSAAGLFAYKGSDGLMLISKYPFSRTEYLDWSSNSTLNRRGALVAKVKVKSGREIVVACTHLAANLKSIPYTGKSGTWANDHQNQMRLLLSSFELVDRKTPIALLGDFNCGPTVTSKKITGELESACLLPVNAGFTGSLSDNPNCTYCGNNTLNKEQRENVLIDHIFTKNLKVVSEKIVYKEKVMIKNKSTTQETNLSDHFGVRSVVLP